MTTLRQIIQQSLSLTAANMKSRYRRTFAGFIWVIMNPILLVTIQSLVFKNILRITVDNYSLFLLGGLLPWIFISQTIDLSASIFINSSNLLKCLDIHPLVIINAQLLENAFNYLSTFLIVLFFSTMGQGTFVKDLLLLFFPVSLLLLGTFLLSWIMATLNVFFRDTRFLISVSFNLLFFITPIFYPASLVPKTFQWLVLINPVYHLIKPVRNAIYHYERSELIQSCFMSSAISLIFLTCAIILWKNLKNEFYFKL